MYLELVVFLSPSVFPEKQLSICSDFCFRTSVWFGKMSGKHAVATIAPTVIQGGGALF